MSPNVPAPKKTGPVLVVAVGYVRDLAPRLSAHAASAYGHCPLWFHRQDVEDKAKVFDRLPETSDTTDESDEVLEVLEVLDDLQREFSKELDGLLAEPNDFPAASTSTRNTTPSSRRSERTASKCSRSRSRRAEPAGF